MPNIMVEAVQRFTEAQPGESPFFTPIPGLIILRSEHQKLPSHLIYKPALCVVVQGAKSVNFGERRFEYKPGQALVVSIEMPGLGRVEQASSSKPFLGLILEFDLAVMSEVMQTLASPPEPGAQSGHGVFVIDLAGPLADCLLRMVSLLGTPQAIPLLAPMIAREIVYWLLSGPQGSELAKMVLSNSHNQRIVRAIRALREQFSQTVRVDKLAAIAQLSASAFHRQFKALTGMTPLQYQKQLRLIEARHILANGEANAETAAFKVGYESASQFSREYSRMFGSPPRRDIAALRQAAA